MNLKPWRTWGFTGRLVTIAVAPATLMFLVISLALYFSGRDEIRSDIAERGNLLAAGLAESSQYAVVSGNVTPLNESLYQLLNLDQSVIGIEILDPARRPLVAVGRTTPPRPEAAADDGSAKDERRRDEKSLARAVQTRDTTDSDVQIFEWPIRPQVPDVDVFDKTGRPHVSSTDQTIQTLVAGNPAGYVRITMSAAPVLEAKRYRVYITLVVVLLATLFSAIAGLYLAQRLRQPLATVMTALRGIREGNYKVELTPSESGEMGELQTAIIEMAKGLGATRQELEQLVEARTRALQDAIEAANQADAERRRLIAQGNVLIEEERRLIAIEIHDHLNASLVVLQLAAQRIAALVGRLDQLPDGKELAANALTISTITANLYSAARNIVTQLRPEVIDTLGLKGAIQEMVRTYDLAHSGCRFFFQAEEGVPPLTPQLTITAYRVVQEALSNIVKHATATSATVSLWRNRASLCLKVKDNGIGFDAQSRPSTGIGLISMRERVTAAGGVLKLTSAPGSGTEITIELPYEEANVPQ